MVEQKDRFGELIGDALRDDAARCHLPSDFTRRLLCGVRTGGTRSCAFGGGEGGRAGARPSRWLKIAASLAAMASFAAFASWVGVTVGRAVLSAPEKDEPAASVPTDPETEAISNQGENTMIARKMATLVGAAMVSVAVPAQELTSEPTFVFLRPETSSFWNTATNSTMTLPIDFPPGAKTATLDVQGVKYSRRYENITGASFELQLPEAVSPETENVYGLTLTFDDMTVRKAKLGLVQSFAPGANGMTRCLAPADSGVWNEVNKRAVIPIPFGTTLLTVNGEAVDTGLGGAQGWYAIPGKSGETYSLSLMAGGVERCASLMGFSDGMLVILN